MSNAAKTKSQFIQNCEDVLKNTDDVQINYENLKKFATALKVPTGDAYGWNEYLSAKALGTEPANFYLIFTDLMVITAQNAGYLYKGRNGKTSKWEIDNSGAKALLKFFNTAAEKKALPSSVPSLSDRQRWDLSGMLSNVPFSKERFAIFEETCSVDAANAIQQLEKLSKGDNGYAFDMNSVEFLAEKFPKAYGDDPYRKKAVLLLLMVAGHLRSRGVEVKLNDLIVPADYRIPETLNAAGVIKMSDDMIKRIEGGELFDQNDKAVTELRAASIKAVNEICRLSSLNIDQVDLALWMASRDGTLERLKNENKYIKVANTHLACKTMWF